MPHKTTVKTNGQILKVNASVSHWTTEALALTASGTNDVESTTTTTITSDYDLFFANTATTATITVKQLDGTTIATYPGLQVNPGVGPRTLNPVPDPYQLASDAGEDGLTLAPTGALAETLNRNTNAISNATGLTSGQLRVVAIHLTAGTVVSRISFMSGTQAAVAPTAQWFALYNSSLALLAQTADDTSTAWNASTVKTLAIASPVTVASTGLHYLGIMVAAGTVPSLMGAGLTAAVSTVAPIMSATSTGSLTDTAPDPAGSLTGAANMFWAWVS